MLLLHVHVHIRTLGGAGGKKMSVGGVEELYKNYGILADAGDSVTEVRELPDCLWFTWT